MDAVENLLCGLVFRTVENREDIIFLCVVVPAVFPDKLLSFQLVPNALQIIGKYSRYGLLTFISKTFNYFAN